MRIIPSRWSERSGQARLVWLSAVFAVFAFVILLDRVADVAAGRPVREVASTDRAAPPHVSSDAFPPVAAALSSTVLAPGHSVEILTDARLFERMFEDIARARRSITVSAYYCEPGMLGDRLAQALSERARAGVTVLFLADGFACRRLIRAIGPRLEAAGAEVALLRPVRWYSMHRIQHRNHARMVVLDGEIGYTGGFGLADEWIGSAEGAAWRETSVRFTGPSVRDLQAALLAAWAEATGTLHGGAELFPPAAVKDGDVRAGLLVSLPGIGTTAAERMLAVSLTGAQRTLFIANAYFVPTPLMRSLLADAVRRSVDVRLLLPGPRTDLPSTRWAGRGYYGELLEAGVRIFEYDRTMMHAKTMVADGRWSVIGSMNLDNRSTRLNDEAALLVYDSAVAAELDSLFLADLRHSVEVTLPAYRARPLWQRTLERATRVVAPLL